MRLDPKKMAQHQVYTPNFGVTYQGQEVVQLDPHFGVQWLIQYFWCHFQVQTQIFGSNMNLNPLIQSGPGYWGLCKLYRGLATLDSIGRCFVISTGSLYIFCNQIVWPGSTSTCVQPGTWMILFFYMCRIISIYSMFANFFGNGSVNLLQMLLFWAMIIHF